MGVNRFIATAFVALSACGSLRAASGPAVTPVHPQTATTDLRAVEGRPGGLVLALTCANPHAVSVELYRVQGEGEPVLLQDMPLSGARAEALVRGVELVDGTVVPGTDFTYQLFAIDDRDRVIERSSALEISWGPSPPRPLDFRARAPFVDVVELGWTAEPGLGVVVFRRDVLTDGPFERVGLIAAPATTWVDRAVHAGGVWSYRIAFARQQNGFVQFGAPSEELYASTPEGR